MEIQVDLASLAVFRAVAQEQSITRAAELLGRAPSNVTTRIQQLEAELGVALFQRHQKRMALTTQGAAYLDYADRILNLADEAQQTVNPTGPTGVLRIGSMECTTASRLPQPLARYNAAWPDVTLDLSVAPTRQSIEALLAYRIDCGLIALPADEWLAPGELETVPIFREELVLLLPPGHPTVESPADIRPRALAAFAPGCTYRARAQDWLTGAPRFAIQEVKSYHAMLACTVAGSCISVMPRSVVAQMQPTPPVEIHPLMTVDTCLASRPGFKSPAFAAFRDTLLAFSNIPENQMPQP